MKSKKYTAIIYSASFLVLSIQIDIKMGFQTPKLSSPMTSPPSVLKSNFPVNYKPFIATISWLI